MSSLLVCGGVLWPCARSFALPRLVVPHVCRGGGGGLLIGLWPRVWPCAGRCPPYGARASPRPPVCPVAVCVAGAVPWCSGGGCVLLMVPGLVFGLLCVLWPCPCPPVWPRGARASPRPPVRLWRCPVAVCGVGIGVGEALIGRRERDDDSARAAGVN